MLPVIAIVGRPNVGKSTFFNRLTKSRSAIVSDFSGLTRDRQYGRGIVGPIPYLVADTGGLGDAETELDKLVVKQTLQAIREADVILFLVDARRGLTSDDAIIAKQLRKTNKPIYLVINKIDGLTAEIAGTDFSELGFSTAYTISAAHGLGVEDLMAKVLENFVPMAKALAVENDKNTAIKIAIIGRPNVGKSTLVNRILGEERVVVCDKPGTTRDSIFVNLCRRGRDYVLIDTAGVRRRGKVEENVEKISVIKTLQSIEASNVVIFLIDAHEQVTEQDLKLIGFILESGKALVIAVNKWDNIPTLQRERIHAELDRRLSFVRFAELQFISALHGTGVGNLFRLIVRAYRSATKEIKTADAIRILQEAIQANPPPLARGKSIKLLYAHVGGHNPPIIVIHGVRAKFVPSHYAKYLENYFRSALRLFGTPLRIEFKENEKG